MQTLNIKEFIEFIKQAKEKIEYTFISKKGYREQDNERIFGFIRINKLLGGGPIVIFRKYGGEYGSACFDIYPEDHRDLYNNIIKYLNDNVFYCWENSSDGIIIINKNENNTDEY